MRGEPNVSYICSRYYRAPELIFGATDYTSSIGQFIIVCFKSKYIHIFLFSNCSILLFVFKSSLFNLYLCKNNFLELLYCIFYYTSRSQIVFSIKKVTIEIVSSSHKIIFNILFFMFLIT